MSILEKGLVGLAIVVIAIFAIESHRQQPPVPTAAAVPAPPVQAQAQKVGGANMWIPPQSRELVSSFKWAAYSDNVVVYTITMAHPGVPAPANIADLHHEILNMVCTNPAIRAETLTESDILAPDGTVYDRYVIHPATDCAP